MHDLIGRRAAAALAAACLLCGCAGAGSQSAAGGPGPSPSAIQPPGPSPQALQAAVDAASQTAGAPCVKPASLPSDQGAPQPAAQAEPALTDKAKATLKNGCAGLRFQIAADGSVRDASVVVESPEGFGFGRSSLTALREERFDPARSSAGYYYADVVIVQRVVGPTGMIHLDRTLAMWGSHP